MNSKFWPNVARVAFVYSLMTGALSASDDFDHEPINYTQSVPSNAISRLQERLDKGTAKLEFEPHFGYLRSLLTALDVSASSQTLVFSKTSLQRQRISPPTPRSLYFGDDVYVGYCQSGEVLEISAVDAQLGAVFYVLAQQAAKSPQILRQTDNCLICHGSSHTQRVPGHLIRSVFSDADGSPIFSAGTYRIDQTSPLEKRWGGWYVTGEHGSQKHLGNLVIRGQQVREPVDNSQGQNVTDLSGRIPVDAFLTPHSDIVALMVLEHQATAQNLLTQANFTARQALHNEATLNKELGETSGRRWGSTLSRIKSVGEPLVKYLLFSGEAPLTDPISGTSNFAAEFAARGRRDTQGRSLRDFDLQRRMFRYPCSYLVDSPSFHALPEIMQEYVWTRFAEILSYRDQTLPFAHLSVADRAAIREVLRDTHPHLPDGWLTQATPSKTAQ